MDVSSHNDIIVTVNDSRIDKFDARKSWKRRTLCKDCIDGIKSHAKSELNEIVNTTNINITNMSLNKRGCGFNISEFTRDDGAVDLGITIDIAREQKGESIGVVCTDCQLNAKLDINAVLLCEDHIRSLVDGKEESNISASTVLVDETRGVLTVEIGGEEGLCHERSHILGDEHFSKTSGDSGVAQGLHREVSDEDLELVVSDGVGHGNGLARSLAGLTTLREELTSDVGNEETIRSDDNAVGVGKAVVEGEVEAKVVLDGNVGEEGVDLSLNVSSESIAHASVDCLNDLLVEHVDNHVIQPRSTAVKFDGKGAQVQAARRNLCGGMTSGVRAKDKHNITAGMSGRTFATARIREVRPVVLAVVPVQCDVKVKTSDSHRDGVARIEENAGILNAKTIQLHVLKSQIDVANKRNMNSLRHIRNISSKSSSFSTRQKLILDISQCFLAN